MLERYFRHLLKQHGFESVDKVFWSLGYCQGDGCSFTGVFDSDDVAKMAPYLYPADVNNASHRVENLMRRRCVIDYVKEKDFRVDIRQSGNYVHENTMSADWAIDEVDAWDDSDDCEELNELILEHAREVAKKLESAGYGLLEAFNREEKEVWRFKTSRYLFRLSEIEEDPEFTFTSDWDEECFIPTCEAMIEGKERITGLKAEVFDLSEVEDEDHLEECEPLAETTLGGVSCAPDDRFYAGCRRDMIGELIHGIRVSNQQMDALPKAA
ncbi:MAG: hypothetical protein G8D91_15930 [gamma proteobacterium symbiont of Clathrolucina costata]